MADVAYSFSPAMLGIIKRLVNKPVTGNVRSVDFSLLGYEFDFVRQKILNRGMRDFRVGYDGPNGALTPDDLVLQYSFINAKVHFFECRHQFDHFRQYIESLFATGPVTLIDIGCGPATAGAAFAESFPGRNFHYIGIDCATAMLAMAERFMTAMRTDGIAGPQASAQYFTTWNGLTVPPQSHVIVVFCYLFASDSIAAEVPSLATFLQSLRVSRNGTKLVTFYLNSTDARAEESYAALRAMTGVQTPMSDCRTFYCSRPDADPKPITFRADVIEWAK